MHNYYYIDNNNDIIINTDYINHKFNTSLLPSSFINKYQLFEMLYNNYNNKTNFYEIFSRIKHIEMKLRGASGFYAVKFNFLLFHLSFDDENKLYDIYKQLISFDVHIQLYYTIKQLIDKWGRIDFYILSYNYKQYNLFKTIQYIYQDKPMIYINHTLFKHLQNVIISFSNHFFDIMSSLTSLFNHNILSHIMSYIYFDYNKFVFSLNNIQKLKYNHVNIHNITKFIGSSYAYIFSLYIHYRFNNNHILFFDTEASFFSLRSRKHFDSLIKSNPLRFDYIIIPKRNQQFRIYLLEIQGEHHTSSSFNDTTKKFSCNPTLSDTINHIQSHFNYNKYAIPLLELFDKDFKNNNWINIINLFEDSLFKLPHSDIQIITQLSKENKNQRNNICKVKKINNILHKYFPHLGSNPFNIDFLP
jgi:hypothetical protein